MFLMPSRFEPCGLNQMYSLRYGTRADRPGNRRAGRHRHRRRRNRAATASSSQAIPPAESRRHGSTGRWISSATRKEWKKIQQNGMKLDFSWDASAREYVKVYEGAPRRPADEAPERVLLRH